MKECWKCDGTGRLRANRTKNGRYVFAKRPCDECNGTGRTPAQPERRD